MSRLQHRRRWCPCQTRESKQHRQHQPPGASSLSTEHMHIHTTMPAESFYGPLVCSKRGRKLASYLNSSLPQTQDKSLTQPLKRRGLRTACTTRFQVPLLHSAHTGLKPLQSFIGSQTGLGSFQTAFLGLLNHKHKTSSHAPTQILMWVIML